jgi:acetylornithine deacetylase/succinyl-diaminopimelate desuccinylase-like protein
VKHHPELVRAEYAFNEGGGRTSKIGDGLYMSVQTAEKGMARFKLIAKGSPGHASIPRSDNAVLKLAEAVLAIGQAKLPAHITPTVGAYIEGLATKQSAEMAEALRAVIADEASVDEAIAALPLNESKKRYFYAMTHNTASPTILRAGSKINVFPSEAVARVDGRTLPGFSQEEFYQELAPYIPEGVELQFEDEGAALEAELDSPLYDAICASIAEHAPEVTLVPSLITGGTDAKAVVKLGTKVYGFSPALYEPEMEALSLVHGHNERVSIKNLLFGTRILYDVILRFCGAES